MSTARQDYRQPAIYTKLVKDHDIFDSLVDMFVFSASLAYDRGKWHKEDYEGDGEMLWMHFSDKDLYRATAASIAYQHTDDPNALTDPALQLEVMAKYASAGAELLEAEFGDSKGSPRERLLQQIQNHKSEKQRTKEDDVLEKIARSFDDDILAPGDN